MTISLAVILLESTGAIRFGLPVMVALMAAQWTGNIFNHGTVLPASYLCGCALWLTL